MAPHRSQHVVTAGAQAAPLASGAFATIFGLAWTALTGWAGVLFFAFLGAMLFDVLTGIARAYHNPNEKFSPDIGYQGAWKKFGRLCLVGLAFVMDVALISVSNLTGILVGFFDHFWTTIIILSILGQLEAFSALDNLRKIDKKGVDAVWETFVSAAKALRGMDRAKFQEVHPGEPLPARRHLDVTLADAESSPAPPPAPPAPT
jgi:phage-related holin